MLEDGTGVPADPAMAVELYRRAAAAGSALGQDALANIYLIGRIVPRDDATAARYFRMAADQGLPSAENSLGLLYVAGIGVSHDLKEAARWFQAAADHGDATAATNLKSVRTAEREYVMRQLEGNRTPSHFYAKESSFLVTLTQPN
jgi:hypothetical protein